MSGVVLQRVRDSGKCPPSLLSEAIQGDSFEETVLKVMDVNAFCLISNSQIAGDFMSLLQMLSGLEKVTSAPADQKSTTLSQRRAVVLTIVGCTPTANAALPKILSDGYLTAVNSWLSDILSGEVGGTDLLLHLLSNISTLPVDKSVVKNSGMGKAIGLLEKHKLCAGTSNESAIKERCELIKDAWNSSVKAKKALAPKPTASSASTGEKRVANEAVGSSDVRDSKRPKVSSAATSPSLSSLLKKKGGSPVPKKAPMSISALAAKSRATSNTASGTPNMPIDSFVDKKEGSPKKKSSMRVKWEDHFGGEIARSKIIEATESAGTTGEAEKPASWNDRKKRDRLREKELLAKAKKSKLIDDDDDDDIALQRPMVATVAWKTPQPLPPIPDVTPTVPTSSEVTVQMSRMQSVQAAQYATEADVPSNPAPLNGNEQAIDMTSHSSAVVSPIPFFTNAPQETPASAPALPPMVAGYQPQTAPAPAVGGGTAASADYVQRLGLPPFLIGHDTRALDTLAGSPGLLQTLIDSNGMYDQKRLLDLVQTLTPQGGVPPVPQQAPQYQPPPAANAYGAPTQAYGQPQAAYGAPPAAPKPSFRTGSEGNLHVSGYGPTTTQAEIIALFAPYVRVDEVVMKGNFSFVNTNDPDSANRAKEVLTGTLLGGMPIRINPAQRKNREAQTTSYGPPAGSSFKLPPYGTQNTMQQQQPQQSYGAPPGPPAYGNAGQNQYGAPQAQQMQQPAMAPMQASGNVDHVRDDRGNPATKNLFVAGYGHGTTEQQLRDVFGQYANVIGVILKGTFSFVNTSDKAMAVTAREMLGNTMLNGGNLRINFAKETGRLGTSFDITYNQTSGPNANAPVAAPAPPVGQMNYYGRGY